MECVLNSSRTEEDTVPPNISHVENLASNDMTEETRNVVEKIWF